MLRKTAAAVPLALALALGAGCAKKELFQRPHVLLITLDTTRADALSCYGAPAGATPALDALAAEGARFDMAISTAALTPVAHASILTGLDTWRHGVRVMAADSGYALAPSVPTLATILREHGWRTAAFHSSFTVSGHFGLDQGFEVLESFEADMDQGESGHDWDVATFQRRSDATTDLALRHLESSGDEPSFTWVHYWDPHDPMLVPPAEHLPERLPRGPDGALLPTRALYAAEVGYMDSQIGRLIAALRARDRLDDTLVVVVADHGEGLQDHGWHFHRVLYQEQVRVPFLVRVPPSLGEVRRRSIGEVVSVNDVLPTVLDYLGIEPPPVSGRSLRPLLEGGSQRERVVFADALNGYDLQATITRSRPHEAFSYCATDGHFKLIYRPAEPSRSELFDLQRDPRELENLIAARPEQTLRLLRELARTGAWVSAPFAENSATPRAVEASSPKAARALAALGYAGGDAPDPGPWAWVCPLHPAAPRAERSSCPLDGEPPVLIARGAALFTGGPAQR